MVEPGYEVTAAGTVQPNHTTRERLKQEAKQMETQKLLDDALIKQAGLIKKISEHEQTVNADKEALRKLTQLILSLQNYNV